MTESVSSWISREQDSIDSRVSPTSDSAYLFGNASLLRKAIVQMAFLQEDGAGNTENILSRIAAILDAKDRVAELKANDAEFSRLVARLRSIAKSNRLPIDSLESDAEFKTVLDMLVDFIDTKYNSFGNERIVLGHPSGNLMHLFGGKNVFVRTVTYFHTGRLVGLLGDGSLVLEDASWVADTGRWERALKTGELDEVEPFPDGKVVVPWGGVIDVAEWKHPLPREVK